MASLQNQERLTLIHDCLAHPRRRYTLNYLKDTETPLAVADLAADIADWETDTPRSEISAEIVEDVKIALYHNHIPRLADADLVQYDQERNVVALSECPKELWDNERLLARP